jgi:hypothetical protein
MIFDVNTWYGRWPFQKLNVDTPALLKKKLIKAGITSCALSSTDAVLVSDPDIWNARLFDEVRGDPFFLPVPVFNPCLFSWERILEEYRKCGIQAVRFLPGYHSYALSDIRSIQAVKRVHALGMLPLIQIRLEDERSHHLLMKVTPPSVEEVIAFAKRIESSIVVLAASFFDACRLGIETKNVFVDISYCERMNLLARMAHSIPVSRILFGSHAAFFYPEAAVLKLFRAELGDNSKELIGHRTADSLFTTASKGE